MLFVFSNTDAGTAARGRITSEPIGNCYAGANNDFKGVRTKSACKQQYPNWTYFCPLPSKIGDVRCEKNQSTSVKLCSRTTNDTLYGPAADQNACGGNSYNRFYGNCEYLPGSPPWKCTGGGGPPPPLSDLRAPGGKSGDIGICAITTNVTTYAYNVGYGACRGLFYKDCHINTGGGNAPWSCD